MAIDRLKIMQFAEMANETKGCSFTITRNKNRKWVITLINVYDRDNKKQRTFRSLDIYEALRDGIEWIEANRRPAPSVQQNYTI